MKRTTSISLILFSALLISVSAAAKEKTTTRQVNIDKSVEIVNISNGLDVTYIQDNGGTFVKVEAPEKYQNKVLVQQTGNILNLSLQGNNGKKVTIYDKDDIHVYVHAPSLQTFNLSSAAELDIPTLKNKEATYTFNATSGAEIDVKSIYSRSLVVNATSAADVEFKSVDCKNVIANASSGSDVKFTGNAVDVVFHATSGADIDARRLKAINGEASSTSGADIHVNVTGTLRSSNSSGGDVVNHAK